MQLVGYPKKITLKDGIEVEIRPMTASHRDALLAFFRGLPEEDRLFLREDVTKPEIIDRFVTNLDYDKALPLLAFHGEAIVGDATLIRSRHGWTVHVGQIRLVVAREFQRNGLGRVLAKLLVEHAVGFGLDKLVAEVISNQVGAKKALTRLGFHKEAVLKKHVKDIHGTKRDLLILSNDVSHIWEAMESMARRYLPSQE